MKKINFTNVLFLIGIGFFISCNNPSLEDYSINEKENQIEKNYFTKDVKNGFRFKNTNAQKCYILNK